MVHQSQHEQHYAKTVGQAQSDTAGWKVHTRNMGMEVIVKVAMPRSILISFDLLYTSSPRSNKMYSFQAVLTISCLHRSVCAATRTLKMPVGTIDFRLVDTII